MRVSPWTCNLPETTYWTRCPLRPLDLNNWPIVEYLKERFRNQQSYNNCRALAHAAAEHDSMESSEGEGDKGDEANEGKEGDASNKGDEGDPGDASNDEDL